ncbi:MAG: hypothetical protein IJF67_17645 [Clostridia bacterium]|nr:hypothetical protein [Clostridia bacterium]
MFQKKYLAVKICAGILLNLLLCLVFFILSSIPDHGIFMSSWHLALFLIWYPLTAIGYGAGTILAACGDMVYAVMMGVSFLAVAVLNALTMDIVALPAAFVYTGIMLAAALLTVLLRAAVLAYLQYRNYKKKETITNEQDSE